MEEKRKVLEEIKQDIFHLTAKCAEFIPYDQEDGKVIYQGLLKASIRINEMLLNVIKGEGS